MNTHLSPLRPAMTAIAAVIALSSTPLLAQATDAASGQAAPVVVAPPPPAVAAPPAVVSTAAPEAAAPAPVEASPAPAPAMKTVGTPVVHEADASTNTPSAAAPTRSAPVNRISTGPSTRASSPAVATLPPAKVAPAKVDQAPAPVAASVAKTVPTAAETAAATPSAAAPVATSQTTRTSTVDDETLPIAGGIGLAVIALGGAAYAFSRRRRDREDDQMVFEPAPVEATPVPAAEPAMAAAAPATFAPARATPRTLPSGFDISRFGRHTQAAYLGPTPDNPSYSLKRRLKRASFFDQREREAAAAGRPIEQTPIPASAPQAARAKQDDGQITVRLAPQRQRGGLGYLFQR